ncbi:MAG: recombination mediator RecR [Bdellovibrionota bacterium]
MKFVPRSLQALVVEFARLPGVGERTALRFAVALLKGGNHRAQILSQVLGNVQTDIGSCTICGFWTEANRCPICEDVQRNAQKLCVVRDSPDVLALEKFRSHTWKYHVLGGLLSPLSGIGPDKLNIGSLLARMRSGDVQELILAFDATVEGDATAYYLKDLLKKEMPQVQLSRTALGLPAGSSVEYLDPSTLESALLHRTPLD